MKMKMATLILASILLVRCGSENSDGGSWEDSKAEGESDTSKPAKANVKAKAPENKNSDISTPTPTEADDTGVVSNQGAEDTPAPNPVATSSIRILGIEVLKPGWALTGADSEGVEWHTMIGAINASYSVVSIDKNYSDVSLDVKLLPQTQPEGSNIQKFVSPVRSLSYHEDETITLVRNKATGECQIIYFVDGLFSDATINMYGLCK